MTTSTGPTWAQQPPNPTNLVRVTSYGYGARSADCGRDGEIVATNRTRPTIRFSNGEQRNIGWACLAFTDAAGRIVRDGNGNPLPHRDTRELSANTVGHAAAQRPTVIGADGISRTVRDARFSPTTTTLIYTAGPSDTYRHDYPLTVAYRI